MSLIARVIRFNHHDIGLLLAAWPALIAYLIYRYPTPTSAATLLALCLICFCLPYAIRSKVVLNYHFFRRPISTLVYVVLVAMIVMRFVGHYQVFHFVITAYFSLALGTIFWAASDPMMDMVLWLAFPTEFERVPDEIQLFDTRMIAWPDCNFKIRAHLFRFRYDDKWSYGITGPLTFAFFDQDFEGMSPREIYSAYAVWYDTEGIGGMIKAKLEEQDAE